MITYGGERVSLTAGAPGLESIGVSLGRMVRFAGHTTHFYTVLAHSFTVAAIMPEEIAIYGLMHDAQESLVADVPTPMKSVVARNREHALQKRIYIANGLAWPVPEAIQEVVDEADHTALIAEAIILGHAGKADFWGTEYDEAAGRETRKNLKKVYTWLDPEKSSSAMKKQFKKYASLAGLNDPAPWD